MTALVEMREISLSFGPVKALRGVDFDLQPGEVHALLGQNGAGKSTLIKILSGVNQRDGGDVLVLGKETHFKTTTDSRDAGIAMVYQELSLIPGMTVESNLYLGREPKNPLGLVKRRELRREVRRFLADQGLPLEGGTTVSDLPFAYRQMTEIAKALFGNVKVLVLDEPTSALSAGEEQILFNAVAEVTKRGVGVIYVTHRLHEVFRISDRVTVLRDGLKAGTYITSEINMETLVRAIVGPGREQLAEATISAEEGSLDEVVAGAPAEVAAQAPIVELHDVVDERLNGVNLTVRPGEIVGLAGMIGSGRTEILETMFGLRPIQSGEVRFGGEAVTWRDPYDAIASGVALVPEDRHIQGVVLDNTIEFNTAVPQYKQLTRGGMFRRRTAAGRAQTALESLRIKAPGIGTKVRNLSGGNQQKTVFGKWLDPVPKLLLLDEPTVGVDVGAREEIYGIIRQTALSGSAVVVVSSDLVELELLCDQVAVVANGRVVTQVHRSEVEGEEALHHLVQEAQT